MDDLPMDDLRSILSTPSDLEPIQELWPGRRREPVTAEEAQILRGIGESITSIGSRFSAAGYLEPPHTNCAIFYSTAREELNPDKLRLISITANATEYAKLHEVSVPSPLGIGSKTVHDESYRLARELKPEAFALNFDPLGSSSAGELIPTISALCETDVYAKLCKLNSYAQGGFFRPHQDTPKTEDHIGTLVLILPSPFEGGQFVLRHSGKEIELDWSKSSRGEGQENLIRWLFFFSDVEHEILPVTEGYRVTLSYDIFKLRSTVGYTSTKLDATHSALYTEIVEGLRNPSFLPNGGTLAFGLQHQYPVRTMAWQKRPETILKGSDLILKKILDSLGLDPALKAVYCVSLSGYMAHLNRVQEDVLTAWGQPDPAVPNMEFIDDFGSRRRERQSVLRASFDWSWVDGGLEHHENILLTSDDFGGINEHYRDLREPDLFYHRGMTFDQEIIWVQYPKGHSTTTMHFHYGNDGASTHCYAFAAFMVTIPPHGEYGREKPHVEFVRENVDGYDESIAESGNSIRNCVLQ